MKRPSFQFYSSEWTGSKWVAFDPCFDVFPRKPCCYVVYLDGALSYVGQTNDLAMRVSSHGIRLGHGKIFTKWGQFDSVIVKARFADKFGDWAMRELRLINRLQPLHNVLGIKAAKETG